MRKVILSIGLASGFLFLLVLVLRAHAGPVEPLGVHCGDVGPLPFDDPNFCGCTWGEVLIHGRPVPGAAVMLTFGSGITTEVTSPAGEPAPFFDLTAYHLGARRGDVLTLTAHFGGRTVSRTFRAWPDAEGEQYVVLALPEGIWSPWVTGGYTRALALAGDVVWAGGPAGLISVSLSSGISTAHTLPWPDPSVRALAMGTDGHVWAAAAGGMAELVPSSAEGFDGMTWQTHTVPLSHTLRALAADPTTEAVWLGDGDGAQGSVAVYTDTWRAAGTFGAPVTALAVDAAGRAWAGTWGEGVYRQDGSGGWARYRAADGLASDNVLAAVADAEAIWFGTSPYLSGEGPRGGIARYDLAMEAWQAYTTVHGLPADVSFLQSPAPIYTLAQGEDGMVWAGTAGSVCFLADADWWAAYTSTHGLRTGPVMAVIADAGTVVAAPAAGLDRLDPTATPGALPVAQIDALSPLTLTVGTTLTLSGSGLDGDEGGARIVAWDWSSSLDGPLCTSANCALPYSLLTSGVHSITLKVQDDEGGWSVPVTGTVMVEESQRVYLPLVLR